MGRPKSRKTPRALVTLVARYRSPTTFEYAEEQCHDISLGGMFIESDHPAPAGSLMKIECEASEHPGRIRGVARVAWLRRNADDDGPAGMGVRFVRLEPSSHQLIERLQARAQQEGPPKVRASQPPAPRPTDPPQSGDTLIGLAAPPIAEQRASADVFPSFGIPREAANVQNAAPAWEQSAAASEPTEQAAESEASHARSVEQHVADLGAAALAVTAAMSGGAAERALADALEARASARPPPPAWHTWTWTLTFVLGMLGILLSDWLMGGAPERSTTLRFVDSSNPSDETARPAAPEQSPMNPARQPSSAPMAPAPFAPAPNPMVGPALAPTPRTKTSVPTLLLPQQLASTGAAAHAAAGGNRHTPSAAPRQRESAIEAKPTDSKPPPAKREEPMAEAKTKGSALDVARACLAQGDNACVLAALDGRAKTAAEYELLIETLRSVGRSADAQKAMTVYLHRFPEERRAAGYRRLLETQTAPKAAAPAAAPPPATRPPGTSAP